MSKRVIMEIHDVLKEAWRNVIEATREVMPGTYKPASELKSELETMISLLEKLEEVVE